jgi:hypothetical protein
MMSAAQLKAQLRDLGGIEPPGRLRGKLMAAVPAPAADRAGLTAGLRWSKVVRYVGAAAVIVVLASVIVQRFTAASGPPQIIPDKNDRSGTPVLMDTNHPWPRDINVCDNNAVP